MAPRSNDSDVVIEKGEHRLETGRAVIYVHAPEEIGRDVMENALAPLIGDEYGNEENAPARPTKQHGREADDASCVA
ncbi:hypothetical protein [Slackia exigua]|uniref:hypothetical protein n=1 Tax=Slackia exigua TaxID=84109 RepID=UPI0028DBAF28|nr:hypothetical protein [Slackia exigua]